MSDVIDVFVGNLTLIDEDVFDLWLDGLSAFEATKKRQRTGILRETGATMDILLEDTKDQYRNLYLLEKYLHNPPRLAKQMLFQLTPSTQKLLIEKYYQFDDIVVREILGKKLSRKHRKDLDDINENTGILLRSCRRQYDNFKRVFKAVEDMEGEMVKNIQNNFLLSERLAKEYAAIVFFANNRFETSKKRLHYVTFSDFAFCADLMISNWTTGSQDSTASDLDADFDREFLKELRELKILNDRELSDHHKSLVCSSLQSKIPDKILNDIESNFKSLSRSLMNVASGMIHSKDLRDFFSDIVEKFIEPCKQGEWSDSHVSLFLKYYTTCTYQLDTMRRQPRLLAVFQRFMTTFSSCISKLYHN